MVAIGAFDGVHLGHQRLITAARQRARDEDAELVVLTFWPPPLVVLSAEGKGSLLCTREQKAERMRRLGVDRLITLTFDRQLAAMSPGVFAREILGEQLGADLVFVGYNFTFGRNSRGSAETLRRCGADLGFDVEVFSPVRLGDRTVSSTLIRSALEEGRVCCAAALLGRPFSVEGLVVRGEGRGGRQIGYPTANLRTPELMMLPRDGVYAVQARPGRDDTETYPGVCSVGASPTFARSGGGPVVEVHLIGFSGDLYGCEVTVEFRRRLRDQRAFSSAQALREQIARDIEAVWAQSGNSAAGGT